MKERSDRFSHSLAPLLLSHKPLWFPAETPLCSGDVSPQRASSIFLCGLQKNKAGKKKEKEMKLKYQSYTFKIN